MRKTHGDLENPIDNLFIDMAESTNSFYRSLRFTPNMLTTISLMLAILAVYLFFYDYRVLAAIIFLISYYFDCADGSFARKYNMVTDFGDIYDHVADIIKIILPLGVMYYKDANKFLMLLPFLLIILPKMTPNNGRNTIRSMLSI